MTTDLEIARAAQMEPVEAVAWKLGISAHELTPMGNGVAKITWRALKDRFSKPQGSLVLVTSVNPTPFGEGKTVTTIGLTQALCRIGQSATCVVREPSMGPVFGIKGGAAGGGHAQVLPMEDINLHLNGDLGGAGAMALLLRQAFLPNITQTLEGDPAFIHGGPFANIAHGNSSIIADRMALASADLVITEAGFGSDMGAEKFMHIKAATSGKAPDCVVMNVTVRSMKLHGGAFGDRGGIRPDKATLEAENVEATTLGAKTNLDRHIRNMAAFGVPVVVSINRFASDTDAELAAIAQAARDSGASSVCITEVHAKGGEGGKDLAEAVVKAVQNHVAAGRPFVPMFTPETDVLDKATAIAQRMYKADDLDITPQALRELDRIRSWGYGHLPVCMAKTQYSFSHDASLLGAPTGFTIPVREFRLNAGAGFIVAVLGNMMTMPGLPKRPAALDMDMDEDGNLLGVFG